MKAVLLLSMTALAAAHRAIAQPFPNTRLEKRNPYPLQTTLDDRPDLSICTIPISKPCKVIATFWDGTGDSINVNFLLDGGFKKFPDARAYSTISVLNQARGCVCEWRTSYGALWTLETGENKVFGPPGQIMEGRCLTST